jgi:type VI secretion system protein ImpE
MSARPLLGDSSEGDAIRLARTTVWHDTGRTGVIALGQKTWTTSTGDTSLFELATCAFGNKIRNPYQMKKGGANGQA